MLGSHEPMNKRIPDVLKRLGAKCPKCAYILSKTRQKRPLTGKEKKHMAAELYYCQWAARIVRNRVKELRGY